MIPTAIFSLFIRSKGVFLLLKHVSMYSENFFSLVEEEHQ